MAISNKHGKQTIAQGIHGTIAYEYANAATRLAASGFQPEDIYKQAIQLDDKSVWILTSISPVIWAPVGSNSVVVQGISAGTGQAQGPIVVFSNSNGVSFGANGSTITASVLPSGLGGVQAAGTTLTSGNLLFSNSNGITFGINGSVLTASIQPGPAAGVGAIQAGTQTATSGTINFVNSNGLTFGMSNSNQITASYTVPSTAGLISNINVSAGSTSNNLSAVTFSNSNNVSFGLNNGTVTASIPNQTSLSYSNANGLSFGIAGSTLTGSYTVPTQSAQTQSNVQGISAVGGVARTGDVVFSNSNGVSFGINGNTITASVLPSGGAGVAVIVGTQTATSGTISFINSNGITFGMSNSSQITASYTVPNVPAQTQFILSNSNGISFGTNGSTVTASYTVPTQTVQTQSNIQGISVAGSVLRTGDVIISNSNGISFGLNGNTLTASYTVPTQSSLSFSNANGVSFGLNGSTLTASVSNQTAYQFSNSNGISFGTNGSTVTASYTVPNVPAQTSVSYSNANGVSFGLNGSTLTASVTPQTSLSYSNANGLSFGINGSTLTGSYTIPTQTSLSFSNSNNVSFGIAGSTVTASVSQTVQTQSNVQGISAGTTVARTGDVVFSNSNGITFGLNGNTLTGSYTVPSTAGLISAINVSGGTTSNNLTAITFSNSNNVSFGLNGSVLTGSVNSQTSLSYSNLNGISFGIAGSTLTASYTVPTQSNQTEGRYAIGNTTGQSSSSTFDARTISLSGAGNVSVGYSGNALVISGGGGGGSVNISAGTTSNNLTNFVLSNSNGLSFGLNGSTLTGSYTVPTQTNQTIGVYAVSNTTGQSSSSTFDARSLSFQGAGVAYVGNSNGSIVISVPAVAPAAFALSAGTTLASSGTLVFSNSNGISFGINGNTLTATVIPGAAAGLAAAQAGTQTATSGTLNFANSNGITFGMSNSSQITASYTVPSTAGLISAINVSGGTTSNNLSAITFNNANNVSFGLNGSVITASVNAQSNQTEGRYAIGNTTGQSSSSTFDARTLSLSGAGNISIGYSGNALIISGSTPNGSINVSAGTTSNNLTALTFSNSNGLSFGLNGSTITGSYTVPTQTAQTVGLYATGNTTQNSSTTLDVRTLSFNGLGNISVGYFNGSIQVSGIQSTQTQNIVVPSAGTQTATSGTVVFANSNGLSFGMSGSNQITGSYTVPSTAGLISAINISGGTTSNNLTALTFANGNNVSFGLNGSVVTGSVNPQTSLSYSNLNGISFGVAGSTLTASYTIPNVPAQTNQTVGLYGLGNTTQNSSTTLDARSLSFNGLGAATVGYSNGSIQISAPVQSVQTQSLIAAIYDGANSISTGTIRFSNSNGISFGINGQTLTASVAAQSNQTAGLYALGNTTQNSSTTLDIRSLSFNGLGIVTAGYSNGSIQISATQSAQTQNIVLPSAGTQTATSGTVIFSNSNGISFGMSNSSVITASYTVPTQSNQTEGRYVIGNTTGQSSSSTFDARTMSISGANNISVGYSGNALVISGNNPLVVSAGAGSISSGTLVFSNSNGISFGMNAGTITATITPGAAAGVAAIQAGTQTATSGTVTFVNSNGITFGMSGSSQITASYTVPSIAGLISGINVSAGTTSNNLSALTFSNSNGLSFGLNGSTVTGSYTVPTQTVQTQGFYAVGNTTGQSSSSTIDARTISINGAGAVSVGYSGGSVVISSPVQSSLSYSNLNGISFGIVGSTLTASYTVPTQSAQTVGLYGLGNTTQNSSTTLDVRSLSFNGLGGNTVGYSNGSIQISGVTTGGLISGINISAGTTSNNLTAFVFSNSNGISFGLNGSTVTGSYTVPTQTNQTAGLYALGNTTQNSSTTLDVRSLSFNGLGAATVGYSNGSIQVSVPVQTAQTQSNIQAIYDGANSISTGTIRFTNANGVSFSINGQTISGSVAAQTAQTVGLYALGNTTQNSSTTLDARTLSFNGLGAASVGYSNGSIQISVPNALTNVNISAGTTSNNLTAFVFSNSNNVSFGLNGSTVTATITVPAQTNQTIGLYVLGNTTQNSSTTLDARTLSFNGLGIITAGYSNGSIQISATQSVQTQSNIAGIYDGANSISTGTIRYSNANGVSFGINGQTLTGSVAVQTNQTVGLYAVSNTTGASSSTTIDARSLSFQGAGIVSVGYTNGSVVISVPSGGGGITNVNISAGTTSNNLSAFVFSNSNSISFGLNGSTITASVATQNFVFSNSNNISFGIAGSTITASVSRPQVSQLHWPESPWQTNFPISNASFSLQHFNAKLDVLATQANLLMALTGNTNSSGALTVSLGIYSMTGSTMSLVSSDSRVLTWTSGSQTTNSTIYGGVSGTRYRTVALNSWSVTAGDYMLGMWFRTTNNGTWNAFGIQGPTIVGGLDGNETNNYANGYSTSSYTTAMIGSVNVTNTNYVRTGGNAFQQPGIIFLGSY